MARLLREDDRTKTERRMDRLRPRPDPEILRLARLGAWREYVKGLSGLLPCACRDGHTCWPCARWGKQCGSSEQNTPM